MLAPSIKGFLPAEFIQKENIFGHSFEEWAYWFYLKAVRVFPIATGRVKRGWQTLG